MSPPNEPLRDPWLVAAWPGMAAVGSLAAQFLVQASDATPAADLAVERWFDVGGIGVAKGVFSEPRRARTQVFTLRGREGSRRDLVVVLGEAQPAQDRWSFATDVLHQLRPLRVRRVVTFAAMATPSAPGTPSRVFAAATNAAVAKEVTDVGGHLLEDGEISGMNGLLVSAAAVQGLEGCCLLGEFPFLAVELASPKASAAVLGVFSALAGFPLDLTPLAAKGAEVDRRLQDALERAKAHAREVARAQDEEESPEGLDLPAPPEEEDEPEKEGLTAEEEARLDALFAEAAQDRRKAIALKKELDRLGVFRRYEDRFLDLFKKGE
jgi:proteasome assembly chaperone (PAC2) family protein